LINISSVTNNYAVIMWVLLPLLLMVQAGVGSISGQLKKTDGSPAANIRIAAMDVSSEAGAAMMSITQTDSNGRYRLDSIPPGKYYVAAGQADALRYYSGISESSKPAVLTVNAGIAIGAIDFVFDPWSNIVKTTRTAATTQGGRFFGLVFKAGEKTQMPNVAILLQHTQSGARSITCTNASGGFEFLNLPAGGFTMELLPPVQGGYNGGGYESFASPIILRTNEELEQEIQLRMIMPPAIARDLPELYVETQRRRADPLAPPRIGAGTSPVRGGSISTSIARPETTRDGKTEDSISLQAVVGIDGIVRSLRAVSPEKNPEFTRAALRAALLWQFMPPRMQNGALAEQFGIITVYFER
jgi:hypothetical protein